MRILMLAQFYAPDIGGEERHVQDLSAELTRRGHQVAVATIWHPGTKEIESDQGVTIYRIRSTMGRTRKLYQESERMHAPPFPDPELSLALWKIYQQEQPDIVHAHNWLLHSYLPFGIWKRAPIVLTLHDYSFICAKKRLMYHCAPCSGPGLGKCLECASEHYGLLKGAPVVAGTWAMQQVEKNRVDMFVAVSQAAAVRNGLVEKRLPHRIIPNFLSDEGMEKSGLSEAYTARLPEGDYLLFIGDLSRDKGVHTLLEAYRLLKDAPPLVLIGRKLPESPAELPDNVYYLGRWPHEAVMEAWRRCSVALAPSVWPEPFGIVAIEAMASGRPVVASRTGGLEDIVVHGETGYLTPPGDAHTLAQAIQRLVENPHLREQMGNAARQRSHMYKAGAVVPQIEALYQELIGARSASRAITPFHQPEPSIVEKDV